MAHLVSQDRFLALRKIIQKIRPQLHHLAPLRQERSPVIAAAQFFVGDVGKVPFDDIPVPTQVFPDHCPGGRPKAVPCDLFLRVVAERAQRAVDRVVAHVPRRLRALRHAAKNRPGRSRQRLNVPKDLQRLPWQRHQMGRCPAVTLLPFPQFHLLRRAAPDLVLKADVLPMSQPQLPGPLEQHGGKLQCGARQNIAFVGLDIAQQLPQLLGIGDGAYFSDGGRLFQRDRGRRFRLIVDAQRCAQASG